MIVDYFDLGRISVSPDEANSILVVDSNAVLSETVALQSFQIVASCSREIA